MKKNNYKSVGIVIFILSFFLYGCDSKKEKENPDLGSKIENKDELHLSDQQVQLGHIVVDTVREQALGSELLLTGVLAANKNKMLVLSSRVMGRIEKLYFKNVGEEIHKGQPVYDIYSEDINLALRELKLAIETKNIQKKISFDMDKMIRSSKNKLLLYGLSESQINELQNTEKLSEIITIKSPAEGIISSIDISEGNYVMEGGSVIHIANYSSLWAEAQVFSEDMPKIKESMKAFIYFPDNSQLKLEGKVVFANPELNSSSKVNLIRIEILNMQNKLKPGMQVNVSILYDKFTTIALPTDAIILEEKGAIVWLQTGHNTYKSVMVRTGTESNGYSQITHGLKMGDIIVVSGNYLLNSEYLFKKGINTMEGMEM